MCCTRFFSIHFIYLTGINKFFFFHGRENVEEVRSISHSIGIPGESIGLKFIPSQSELYRFIPISVSEPMRIIPNQSEKSFVSRLMKNGKKSIRLNPINSETSIRMNLNQYETKFWIRESIRFGSIRDRIDSDWKLGSDSFRLIFRN